MRRWSGVIAMEGVQTGDGRVIAEGALYWEHLPATLRWSPEDEGMHHGAVDVGTIDTIERRPGGVVWGAGDIDDESEPGAEVVRQMDAGILRGVSIDPDDWHVVVVDTTITEADMEQAEAELMALFAAAGDPDPGDGPDVGVVMFTDQAGDIVERLVRGRIRAATLVSIPAFIDAEITLDPIDTSDDGEPDVADAVPVAAAGSCSCGGTCDPCARTEAAAAAISQALSAAASVSRVVEAPPAHAFEMQRLDQVSALRRDGLHVYGHIADHQTCHSGILAACITAPRSAADYEPFHRYDTTRDGTPLPVLAGRITAGYGAHVDACGCCPGSDDHACLRLSWGGTIAHHDRMTDVAYIAAGEDPARNAIWFSGVVNPDATPDELAILDRRMISGDWRPYQRALEMTEVLALHRERPGYPTAMVAAGGRPTAAVGVGAVVPDDQPAAVAAAAGTVDLAGIGRAVADELDRRAAAPHRAALAAAAGERARRQLARLAR